MATNKLCYNNEFHNFSSPIFSLLNNLVKSEINVLNKIHLVQDIFPIYLRQ